MSLTPEQEIQLRKPFQPREHGFVNGRPYIRKDAIRRRLSQVDPTWQLGAPTVLAQVDDVVVLAGALIVGDTARNDVGTGIVQRTGRDGKSELPPYEVARNTARAYKTAASDLLPRCAIQFGVGEYLKDVPRNVTDDRSLTDWLRSLARPAEPPAPASTVQSGQSAPRFAGPPARTAPPQ